MIHGETKRILFHRRAYAMWGLGLQLAIWLIITDSRTEGQLHRPRYTSSNPIPRRKPSTKTFAD